MDPYMCKNIGISGLGLHWMQSSSGKKLYKCRKFIAIMGNFNRPVDELAKITPFDTNSQENYVEGVGETKELALKNMEKNESSMADALWVI